MTSHQREKNPLRKNQWIPVELMQIYIHTGKVDFYIRFNYDTPLDKNLLGFSNLFCII